MRPRRGTIAALVARGAAAPPQATVAIEPQAAGKLGRGCDEVPAEATTRSPSAKMPPLTDGRLDLLPPSGSGGGGSAHRQSSENMLTLPVTFGTPAARSAFMPGRCEVAAVMARWLALAGW